MTISPATLPKPDSGKTDQSRRPTEGPGVNFGRVLKSEWIKITTVRSSVVLIISTVIVMVGLAVLGAWSFAAVAQSDAEMSAEFQIPLEGPGSAAAMALTVPSSGLTFGQLTIASLAVVLIASEWTTGMIRSTLVAVPKRTPALLAKTVIVAGIAFLVGLASALASYLIAQPVLAAGNIDFALTQDGVIASIINTGTFLALVAVISMSIGILLRNSAGGIVTAVAVFFVLPLIGELLSGLADWVPDALRFLPGTAGLQMVAVTASEDALSRWEGGLVMGAWALLLLVVALLVAKKRDV